MSVLLATLVANPSPEVSSLIEALGTTWRMGFGAIVALIGGKQV